MDNPEGIERIIADSKKKAEAEALGNTQQVLELLDLNEVREVDENAVSQSIKDSITSINSDNLGENY